MAWSVFGFETPKKSQGCQTKAGRDKPPLLFTCFESPMGHHNSNDLIAKKKKKSIWQISNDKSAKFKFINYNYTNFSILGNYLTINFFVYQVVIECIKTLKMCCIYT